MMGLLNHPPMIYVNGVRLEGATVYETRDSTGAWVSKVHIEAPKFDVAVKGEE